MTWSATPCDAIAGELAWQKHMVYLAAHHSKRPQPLPLCPGPRPERLPDKDYEILIDGKRQRVHVYKGNPVISQEPSVCSRDRAGVGPMLSWLWRH